MTETSLRDRQAVAALRIVLSAMIFIHGTYRFSVWGMPDFGTWLDSQGIPFGLATAWVITLVEIFGTLLLASGRFPRLQRGLALWFAAQLTVGIIMVHAPSGWWVVGSGRNGVEYSVLLVSGFLITAWASPPIRPSA